jgi:hypothetical protein
MRRATRVITFTGFKESVMVWRLTGPGRPLALAGRDQPVYRGGWQERRPGG